MNCIKKKRIHSLFFSPEKWMCVQCYVMCTNILVNANTVMPFTFKERKNIIYRLRFAVEKIFLYSLSVTSEDVLSSSILNTKKSN